MTYPDMDTATVDHSNMRRERRAWALSEAERYIAEAVPVQPPLKPNGYAVDGWKPVNHAERLQMVLKVARFLLGEEE